MLGTNLFSGSTEQDKDDSLTLYVDPISSSCDDPLATNTDQRQPYQKCYCTRAPRAPRWPVATRNTASTPLPKEGNQ